MDLDSCPPTGNLDRNDLKNAMINNQNHFRKAIITDWIEKVGGAERVIQAICEIYKFDYYYAYADQMSETDKINVFGYLPKVVCSPILDFLGKYFRYAMPIFPYTTSAFNKQTASNKVDLIISSSWALSKAYEIEGAKHICYLQSRNFKYIWDEADLYYTGLRKALSFTKGHLRRFDVKSAQNPDLLISNSQFVRDWVKTHYRRDSRVIYPPVDVNNFHISPDHDDYYVTIGRLEPYKRFDIIVDAFNESKKKLLIIGSGSQLSTLMSKAKSNITFLGFRCPQEIRSIITRAKGFVYAGVEDFGIAIVEALASGVPVIAYKGGALPELICDGIDGMLFPIQTQEALNDALSDYEKKNCYDPQLIKSRANKFSKDRFKVEFKSIVDEHVHKWHLQNSLPSKVEQVVTNKSTNPNIENIASQE